MDILQLLEKIGQEILRNPWREKIEQISLELRIQYSKRLEHMFYVIALSDEKEENVLYITKSITEVTYVLQFLNAKQIISEDTYSSLWEKLLQ